MRTPSLLERLPVEIIYEIHLLALNESLPILNKRFYDIFKSTLSTYRPEYLYLQYLARLSTVYNYSVGEIVEYALMYALCNEEVLDGLLRLVENDGVRERRKVERGPRPALPKRLFKKLVPLRATKCYTRLDQPLPFLRHLYAKAESVANRNSLGQEKETLSLSPSRIQLPDANAHGGYALSRAVHAGHMELVKFLLSVGGADPGLKDALAVRIAIKKRDLGLVRCLVEREAEEEVVSSAWCSSTDAFKYGNTIRCGMGERDGKEDRRGRVEGGRKGLGRRKAKRRRVEDRVEVTTAMLRLAVEVDARDIVQYFIDKGARPDFATIQRMGRAGIV